MAKSHCKYEANNGFLLMIYLRPFVHQLNTVYLYPWTKEGSVLFNDTLNTFSYGYIASDLGLNAGEKGTGMF